MWTKLGLTRKKLIKKMMLSNFKFNIFIISSSGPIHSTMINNARFFSNTKGLAPRARGFASSTQKSKFQRFMFGFKKGINLSLLPDKVLVFHNNLFIRIFRVLGGISLILWLSKLYLKLNIY
jgi:hypothetical protein